MKFGERLQKLRKERQYSQEQLADLLGVSRQAVSKWESGSSYPETDKLIELSKLFSISIDELLKEEPIPEKSLVDPLKVEEYTKFYKKFELAIASGVCLCILGLFLTAFVDDFIGSDPLSITVFFSFTGIAVGLFVFYGISFTKYEEFEEDYKNRIIDPKEKSKVYTSFAIAITIGVLLCILGIVLAVVVDDSYGRDGYTAIAFFFPIMLAVFLFVYYGLEISHFEKSKKQQKKNNWSERIQGVIMLVATMIFLILGFLWNAWHPAWVVYPIGGILCGIVEVLFEE